MKKTGMCLGCTPRINEQSTLQRGKGSSSFSSDVTCGIFVERKAAGFAHRAVLVGSFIICVASFCRGKRKDKMQEPERTMQTHRWNGPGYLTVQPKVFAEETVELFQECGGGQRGLGGS